jgi:hypothetical protein
MAKALSAEAMTVRDRLHRDALALAGHGLVGEGPLAQVKGAGAGVLLEEVLSWVRTLPGSQRLRALLVFDEVYGFLPPHPANPPTKRLVVALMKQARAFGVGVIVATRNPMDLDYRGLSNAGLWCLGRLQTDADRARVLDGLAAARGADAIDGDALATTLQRLAPRWFVVRERTLRRHRSWCNPAMR